MSTHSTPRGIDHTYNLSNATLQSIGDQNKVMIDLLSQLVDNQLHIRQHNQQPDRASIAPQGSQQPHQATIAPQGGPSASHSAAAIPREFAANPNLQYQWQNIRDKYAQVNLPEDHRVHESRSDIRRGDQKSLNIITKCGRYTESMLKILVKLQSENCDDALTDLYISLLAMVRYLNDEFAVLFVNSTTNPATSKVFRALRKNTSAFGPDVIADLQSAASVVGAGQVNPVQNPDQNRDQRYRGNFSPFRGRGRGRSFRHQYQGSQYQGSSAQGFRSRNDPYYNYLSRNNIPNTRESSEGSGQT